MSGTPKKTGPVALSTSLTTNIHQGGGGSASLSDVITHVHVTNKTDNDAKFSLWIDATGGNTAGKEWFSKQNVKARDTYHWYGRLPITSADYIVGGADIASALTITIEYDRQAV